MNKYIQTARLSALEKTNGGVLWLLPDVFMKICTLIPLIFLWRAVISAADQPEPFLVSMPGYAYAGALLADLLTVRTAASGWLSEGVLLRLYSRPLPILSQLVAQTIGGWLPMLGLFSLPMALVAPLFAIDLVPASPLFVPSLLLCISLGFAVDALFVCLSIKLRSMNWLIDRIRMAITALFSGTIIPIRLLPFGLAGIMKYQPFACLGGAPLSVFIGAEDAAETLAMQIAWNLILWPIALFVFQKSQEGMVSYGG